MKELEKGPKELKGQLLMGGEALGPVELYAPV
ncbi:hypothetical protein T4A_3576 [Trichinella pseudospiralis]|uniref:Uncharacterized protein n=1 Tax=Trichinella pseudospiralis TaxID=6337 RepID=A0A0V1C6R3_TRIPS|nr:hypothetical protein T4A_3576 [Trichinella pseudospiralis]